MLNCNFAELHVIRMTNYIFRLVQHFCQHVSGLDLWHLSGEDLVYLHSSIRQNVACLLADLFLFFHGTRQAVENTKPAADSE